MQHDELASFRVRPETQISKKTIIALAPGADFIGHQSFPRGNATLSQKRALLAGPHVHITQHTDIREGNTGNHT